MAKLSAYTPSITKLSINTPSITKHSIYTPSITKLSVNTPSIIKLSIYTLTLYNDTSKAALSIITHDAGCSVSYLCSECRYDAF